MRKRILTIDGGGIKGIFPAALLAECESVLRLRSAGDYFDLIAGTSIGGILALALGLGLTAREITDFFVSKGPAIFPKDILPRNSLRLLFGRPRHSAENLRECLREVFGTKTLADSRVRLLIPSFDATRADIHIYKTAHHPKLAFDHRLSAVEVAMATAAAPTYFPSYDSEHCITLIDGGIWANDPTAIAVVEGICTLGWRNDEIDVLSIGCTEETVDFKQKGHSALFWVRRAIDAAIRGQSRSSISMARHLTGRDRGLENIVRVNPAVPVKKFALDDVSGIKDLRGFAYGHARQVLPDLRSRFFSNEAEQFVGQAIPGFAGGPNPGATAV